VKQASLTVAQARLAIAKTMLLIQYRAVSATAKRVRECPYGRYVPRGSRTTEHAHILSNFYEGARSEGAMECP